MIYIVFANFLGLVVIQRFRLLSSPSLDSRTRSQRELIDQDVVFLLELLLSFDFSVLLSLVCVFEDCSSRMVLSVS